MKYIKMVVFFISLIFPFEVYAASCSSKDMIQLQKDALNINADYEVVSKVEDLFGEIVEDVTPEEAGPYTDYRVKDHVYLEIHNITENLSLKIQNVTDRDEFEVTYADTDDGTYVFEVPDLLKIREYKIMILSNHEDCMGEEISSKTVITPMSNVWASYPACLEMDEYYCEPYVTTEVYMSEEELQTKYIEYQEAHRQQPEEEQNENKFPWLIVIGVIGVGILFFVIAFVIVQIRRKVQRSKIL